MKYFANALTLTLACLMGYAVGAHAQQGGGAKADPVVVDSEHYKLEFENDRVRVLRVSTAPGEPSVMHFHPDSAIISLSGHKTRMTTPDGKFHEVQAKAGSVGWQSAGSHLPLNVGDKRTEVIVI